MTRFIDGKAGSVVRPNETRGTGSTWDKWPASLLQVTYVTADGEFLCVVCANGGNGSEANITTETSDQWRIIGAQVINEPTNCAHCDRVIPLG